MPRCEPDSLKCLYWMCSKKSLEHFWQLASSEVAAFFNYALLTGKMNPDVDFAALDRGQVASWLVNDAAEFIRECPWADRVLWCGWPALLGDKSVASQYEPVWQPEQPERMLSMDFVYKIQKLVGKAVTFQPPVDDLNGDLAKHVLHMHPFYEITPMKMLSLSQMVHSLATFSRETLGPSWVQQVILDSWSVQERSSLSTLLPHAQLVFTVLHDDSHWALLVFLIGKTQLVLYDSGTPQREGILQAAQASCKHLGKSFGCNLDMQALKHAKVLPQTNEWSCGHRAVLCANFVLKALVENKWTELPVEVPESQFAFSMILRLSRVQCQTNQNHPSVGCISILDDSWTENDKKRVKCESQPEEPAQKRMATQSSKPATKKRSDPEPSPKSTSSQSVVEKRRKVAKASDEQKEVSKKLEHDWKSLGFTHNSDFQKIHKQFSAQAPKGHWQDFVSMMQGNKPMSCEACQKCRERVQALKEKGSAPEDEQQQQVVVAEPEADEQLVVGLGSGGRKRGRPRKGDVSWQGLPKFLEENRPGIYRLIDQEKHVWCCVLCNHQLKLKRDGMTYVKSHEKSELHKAKLKLFQHSIPVDDAVEERLKPCGGINTSDPSTKFHEIRQSVLTWALAGMPCHTPAIGAKCCNLGLRKITSSYDADGAVILRHNECKGEVSCGPCSLCSKLERTQTILADIKKWAFRLDTIQLVQLRFLATDDEIREHQEIVQSRDYFEEMQDHELRRLMKLSPADAANQVRIQIVSVCRSKRNPALQSLIDLRLQNMAVVAPRNLEQSVFRTLVRNFEGALESGRCHEDQFQIAAQVLWGELVFSGVECRNTVLKL